jgi:signal transduction histidine kinase
MRLTLRTQLTLLYAGPFFVTGAALLAVPLLGARVSAPAGSGSTAPPDVTVHQPLAGSAVGLAVVAVLSLVLGWLIAGRFLRPLRMITATARDISASNLNRRLGLRGRDELTDLADTLDDLFARLEASFESQRHFVANASHELRTPLTAERALLQVALADPDATAESLRSTCRDVLALGEAQQHLIDALLMLATSERGIERREPFDLADIAGRVVQRRHQDAVRVDTALASAPATGDPNLVESMVANLVDNALRHNVTGGWVEIATGATDGRAAMSVRNTGPVVPPEDLERLFLPFQQLGTQRTGGGHGLGLAIVRAIAQAHGATVVPHARPEGGLDIEVTFAGVRSEKVRRISSQQERRISGSPGTPG